MKRLYHTDMTKEEALKICGGYTEINGHILVIPNLKIFNQDERQQSIIITGMEYGGNGEILGLTTKQAKEIVWDILGVNKAINVCNGGYLNSEGEEVTEKSLMISGHGFTDSRLVVLAERIRLAFRQESVIVVLSNGEAEFLEA